MVILEYSISGERSRSIATFTRVTTSTPVLQADWAERGLAVSPDERWLAYVSNETETFEVYVRSWPDLSGRTLVSAGDVVQFGFSYPTWAPSGQTLYYLGADRRMVAAELSTDDGFRVLERRPTAVLVPTTHYVQDLHPDGSRFLLVGLSEQPSQDQGGAQQARLVVVTNWLTELRRRLGEGG